MKNVTNKKLRKLIPVFAHKQWNRETRAERMMFEKTASMGIFNNPIGLMGVTLGLMKNALGRSKPTMPKYVARLGARND